MTIFVCYNIEDKTEEEGIVMADVQIVPWLDEFENYLNEKIGYGKISKVLTRADFDALSETDKTLISNLSDKGRVLSKELLKKPLEKYFKLFENEKLAEDEKFKSIPVFSKYMDWVLTQDRYALDDDIVDMISTKIFSLKTQPTEQMLKFKNKIIAQFSGDIDKMTTKRLRTLNKILTSVDGQNENVPYDNLGKTYRDFVEKMFVACAVRTEIEKNNKEFNGIFKRGQDWQMNYSLMYKIFVGQSKFEALDSTKILERMKLPTLIQYANYQRALKGYSEKRDFIDYLEDYCVSAKRKADVDEAEFWIEKRNYTDFIKQLSHLFERMINSKVQNLANEYSSNGILSPEIARNIISPEIKTTDKMDRQIASLIDNFQSESKFLKDVAHWMIDLVHLDKALNKDWSEIYDSDAVDGILARKKDVVYVSNDYANYINDLLIKYSDGQPLTEEELSCLDDYYQDQYVAAKDEEEEQRIGNILADILCQLDERRYNAEDEYDEEPEEIKEDESFGPVEPAEQLTIFDQDEIVNENNAIQENAEVDLSGLDDKAVGLLFRMATDTCGPEDLEDLSKLVEISLQSGNNEYAAILNRMITKIMENETKVEKITDEVEPKALSNNN